MKSKLTEFEKNLTITTSLSAEDIFLYEKHFNRKLDETELNNAAYLSDKGIRLNHNLNKIDSIELGNIAGVAVEEYKVPISNFLNENLSDHYLDRLRMNQPISNLDYFKK